MKTGHKTPHDEWTILALIQWTAAYFKSHRIDSPRSTAEILLAHVLGVSRIELYLRYDQPLNQNERNQYKKLIRRRNQREPVAYIVGEKEFWSLPMYVNRDVLIPRPETEGLVELTLAAIPENSENKPLRILELGTGSGAVICSLAAHRPQHFFVASDISARALAVADRNLGRNAPDTPVCLICSDLFSALHPQRARFDIIVSNPPYIAKADINGLQPEITRYEPLKALDGGADGLAISAQIIQTAPLFLRSGGVLMLEIGHDQFQSLRSIASQKAGFEQVTVQKDFSGLDRVMRMVKS